MPYVALVSSLRRRIIATTARIPYTILTPHAGPFTSFDPRNAYWCQRSHLKVVSRLFSAHTHDDSTEEASPGSGEKQNREEGESADDLTTTSRIEKSPEHSTRGPSSGRGEFSPALIAAVREALSNFKEPQNVQGKPEIGAQAAKSLPGPEVDAFGEGSVAGVDNFQWNADPATRLLVFDKEEDFFLDGNEIIDEKHNSKKTGFRPKAGRPASKGPKRSTFSPPSECPRMDRVFRIERGFRQNRTGKDSRQSRSQYPKNPRVAPSIEDDIDDVELDGAIDLRNDTFGDEKSPKQSEIQIATSFDDDEDEEFPQADRDNTPDISPGGFRVNIYRNVTGSLKELLVSLREKMFDRVKAGTLSKKDAANFSFLQEMLDILPAAQMKIRSDIRPLMNKTTKKLLDILPELAPDEIGFTAMVLGQASYLNSLLFDQIFTALKEPGTLQRMSSDTLFGTVLSFGMLQSSEGVFMDLVSAEFRRRLEHRHSQPFGKDLVGPMLLGCCCTKEHSKSKSFVLSTLDTIDSEKLFVDPEIVSWSDLAIAVYAASQVNIFCPGLLEGLHSRLLKSRDNLDTSCIEVSVLLFGLERLSPLISLTHFKSVFDRSYVMLIDDVGRLIQRQQVDLRSIPDLIRSLSFPGMERTEFYEPLGQLLVKGDRFAVKLSGWTLVYRLMSGYCNTLYRDPDVLKVVNKRLLKKRLSTISASTIAQLLVLGCKLKALEQDFVKRVVELLEPSSFFWKRVYRAKDAAKIAYSLAGFGELTPEIYGECWKRCSATPFSQYPNLPTKQALDTCFIATGIFAGYEYIRHAYSLQQAREHMTIDEENELYGFIRRRNMTESGGGTVHQKAVSAKLREMGCTVASEVQIEDGLYCADIALLDYPAVALVSGEGSYFRNPPREYAGSVYMLKKALERRKIKVVLVKQCEWLQTPRNERESFLVKCFAEEGIKLKKLCHSNKTNQSPAYIYNDVYSWASIRTLSLKKKLKKDLVPLLKNRIWAVKDPEEGESTGEIGSDVHPSDIEEELKKVLKMKKIDVIREIVDIEGTRLFRPSNSKRESTVKKALMEAVGSTV